MRQVQIYIEDTRESGNYNELELFQDETININLSVQNVKDISKVFTEFTQSFTVPASKNNNAIFRHFYENAVEIDTAVYDPRLRRPAYIEINRKFFRNGKIQLEKSNLKNGKVESYTITFYGTIINLKDTFGDDKLADLDYTTVDFDYTGAEVEDRITDDATDYDVRYPLISSDRLWSYGDSTSTDISVTGGAINYTELYPALKVPKIFDLIELKYGINFTGLFLTDERFNDLFLWYKPNKTNKAFTDKQLVNISSGNSQYYNISTDEAEVTAFIGNLVANLTLLITNVSSSGVTYYVDVYRDGVFQQTFEGQGVGGFFVGQAPGKYTCYVYADSIIDIDTEYEWYVQGLGWFNSTNLQNNLSTTSNLSYNAPDIKVSDFISGVLKMFNLTITAESIDTFLIEPLEWWYQKGGIIDITRHVDIESIDVSKVPLYKAIEFKFQESKNFVNAEYKGRIGKSYGDLTQKFDFDADNFTIEVPFENLPQAKYTNETVQVGFTLDEDYKSYIPKPVLLYQRPVSSAGSAGIKFDDGSTVNTLSQYIPLAQDVIYNSKDYTLNFAPEQSSYTDQIIDNNQYYVWYHRYFKNLFDEKNRLVSIKAIFPISVLTNLRLNDRLIIRDKRYTINSISANLTSGEVQLELLHDLREVSNDDNVVFTDSGAGSIDIPVLLLNGATQTAVSTSTLGVTFSGVTFTSDDYVTVTYPANPIAEFEIITEASDNVITENNINLIDEDSNYTIIPIQFVHTLQNGDNAVNYTYILQEP